MRLKVVTISIWASRSTELPGKAVIRQSPMRSMRIPTGFEAGDASYFFDDGHDFVSFLFFGC